ncbi:MAG: hypothetical protein OXL96_25425 [Candidatus Poribacteria bacterium]|nr:hypothetical protein [Candidatus Poribacteria bacterium]
MGNELRNCTFPKSTLIYFSPAAGLRGERWVTTLYEARNKNEARDLGFKQAQVFRLG